MRKVILSTALFAALVAAGAANAQGTLRGAAQGADEGGRAAGPVGAVVGGAVGPRFREYVVREHRPSFAYRGDIRVGTVLPESGVTYYDVPAEYHVTPGYRYSVVNDRPVIVEPRSRRIVEVID